MPRDRPHLEPLLDLGGGDGALLADVLLLELLEPVLLAALLLQRQLLLLPLLLSLLVLLSTAEGTGRVTEEHGVVAGGGGRCSRVKGEPVCPPPPAARGLRWEDKHRWLAEKVQAVRSAVSTEFSRYSVLGYIQHLL